MPEMAADPADTGLMPAAEELYRSERTIVSRLHMRAGESAVIRKRLLGPDALARTRHEARMLERLAGLPGVAHLLRIGPGATLDLSDARGATLTGAGPIPGAALVDLARLLARILAGVHRRGVLHLDISPANILWQEGAGLPVLIDFHLATLAAEQRRGFTHHSDIAGTLAYIAPELTGRMGQAIDQRADLYQLGATLYDLATGTPPFGQGDALQLIRDHIATLPVPPAQRVPDLPPVLSEIILRLLEKEPDRRYQSAEGLADDLDRLHDALEASDHGRFPLGLSDFAPRLAAPSRLIGRAPELAEAIAAFADALSGNCRFLLISGGAGVGKTALIDRLRPVVTARGGWFVASRFEQFRQDGQSHAIVQLIRGVLALLLAEPEAELAAVRETLHARLGADTGLLLTIVPEMEALLGALPPPAGAGGARSIEAGLAFFQAVVSPARPLMLVLDDLQWAPDHTLSQIGHLLTGAASPGVLLVGACRDSATTPAFAAALQAWQHAAAPPRRLHLHNLPPGALSEFLAEMLRLPDDAARKLAEAIGARTDGNPCDTVELLNGLRLDKTLSRGPHGWRWDHTGIRRHVSPDEAAIFLAGRIAALPEPTRDMLATMACLGGEVAPALLAAASGVPAWQLDEKLSPALEDGLLMPEQGGPRSQAVLRFRKHRVQQALHGGMGDAARQSRHLALARRLAPIEGFATEAAEQYLPVLAAIAGTTEAGQAAALFASAAANAARLFRHDAAERYAGAAIRLREAEPAPDTGALTRLRTARLTALYSLGRYEEADRLFAEFGQGDGDPLALAEATCVQMLSLSGRGRHTEAVPIGLAMLARLGITCPAADMSAIVAHGLASLLDWVTEDAAIPAADRVTTNDPLLRVTARLINRILPTAQLHDPLTGAWLAVENQRLWARHGACPELVANLARTASSPIVFGEDYRTAYAMARHAIAVGSEFGYEPETSLARQNFATFASHWFEPLENTLDHVRAARPGLVQGGEIQAVCINDISCLAALLDCAPALEGSAAELTTARDYATRTGHHHLLDIFGSHHLLLQALTGEIDAAARLATQPAPAIAAKPLALFGFHCGQAIMAALFADDAQLAANSAPAARLTSRIGGAYRCMTANLLHALSLAREARRAGAASLPAALKVLRAWFAARATDAPGNFEHLLHFIDAEAAWTLGQSHDAARAFDRALQASTVRTRPWHHALIAERAGLFHLAQSMDYVGRGLLRDAQARYAAWGAHGVVRRLAAEHGFLADTPVRAAAIADGQTASLTSDAIDLLAILRASQALSSQTTIRALYAQVVETLATMTGATTVHLLVWDDSRAAWYLPAQDEGAAEPLEAAAARGGLPLSAFRIVERTHLPLLVDDATQDDRFARDPYFAALDRCSLLVLPVRSRGAARAVLMLENRLSRGVFSHARLNLVTLVASQLAVSLDNARLYASLEQRVTDRTQALAVANRRLEQLSISDALTGLANRRRFDDMFASEWLRALRGSTSLGLVLVDIDHFKGYNDHYGHVGGDRCLRAVATALQGSVRQDVDLAARYGGEEFALILPGADLRAAAAAAARAHRAVLALQEPHAASPLRGVTVSLGVAARIPADSIGAEQMIRSADAALYCAKQAGRNRVATEQDVQTGVPCALAG